MTDRQCLLMAELMRHASCRPVGGSAASLGDRSILVVRGARMSAAAAATTSRMY